MLAMAAGSRDKVGSVEAFAIIAFPDDMRGHALAFRTRNQTLNGVAHDLFARVDGAVRAVEYAVVRIVAVDLADVALIPNTVRAAHDVINNVRIDIIEATQRLCAGRVLGRKFGVIMPFHLHNPLGLHWNGLMSQFCGFNLACHDSCPAIV